MTPGREKTSGATVVIFDRNGYNSHKNSAVISGAEGFEREGTGRSPAPDWTEDAADDLSGKTLASHAVFAV